LTQSYKMLSTKSRIEVRMESLVRDIGQHCNDDTLIKGWEVERRTCNGRARGKLRAAARNIRKQRKAASQNRTGGVRNLSPSELNYLSAIETLWRELAKAGEQDFDSYLKDGLDWITSKLQPSEIVIKQISTQTVSKNKQFCKNLLQKLKMDRRHGVAADRDLRKATELADECRSLYCNLDENSGADDELKYLERVSRLCDELAKEGESDFDGLIRKALKFLGAVENQKQECRFWSKGKCRARNQCKFLHDGMDASHEKFRSHPPDTNFLERKRRKK